MLKVAGDPNPYLAPVKFAETKAVFVNLRTRSAVIVQKLQSVKIVLLALNAEKHA